MTERTSTSSDQGRSSSPGLGGCTTLLIVALVAGLIGGAGGAAAVFFGLDRGQQATEVTPNPTAAPATVPTPVMVDIRTGVTEAVDEVGPSVVTVVNFLSPEREAGPSGQGSGVIISDQGHVVTNNHVVAEARELEIRLADGTRRPATLVGADPFSDLAVVQAEGELLPPATWGNSDALNPGETVVAIGSPLGDFFNTVTAGVVSAVGRSMIPAVDLSCRT